LRAFAFLLEVTAARFGRLLLVRFRLERLRKAFAEVDEDVLLADHSGAVLEPERGDRVGAGRFAESGARLALDRHLAVDGVEPELGQPLADAA
jgi:hypothetical protein